MLSAPGGIGLVSDKSAESPYVRAREAQIVPMSWGPATIGKVTVVRPLGGVLRFGKSYASN